MGSGTRHRRRRRLGWQLKPVLTGGAAQDGERARASDLREVRYCARQGERLGSGSGALAIDTVIRTWRHGSRLRSGFSFSLYLDLLLIPPCFCVRFGHEDCIDVKNEI
ncbi:hypothetical protein M6B38_326000 [Iris pallida]|uniref:Uncharacterized protein n=1 Tax=Iris pallida TaxID=29817 RepID=A0AAX6H744_IRIPA|nr:hypothetical protein M6B38_326000 [Iris pallida]